MKKHRVWAEVSLERLIANLEAVKKALKPDVKVLVVVKADAYGHGAVPIARTCLENGAAMVGVGDSTEAIHLREAGILAPVLVLGALIEEEIGWVVSYNIIPTLHSNYMVDLVNEEARRQNVRLPVHIDVDTGMTRLGVSPARTLELVRRIRLSSNLELTGIGTHLSSAYTGDGAFVQQQCNAFDHVLAELERIDVRVPCCHVANSGALMRIASSKFNMVRPGTAIYGIDPGTLKQNNLNVIPILSLKTQICYLRGVKPGTPVGYNRTFVSRRGTRIATLPVGYNDGYPYLLSNKARVLVRGQFAPVVGTVTMDYLTVDVGHIPEVGVGDEVVLIGSQGDKEISVIDLARLIGTISYEITCGIGKRVRRVYV
ncbi:MAG: alanine racemase [Planctomycetota bacterium]|nr:alanine racemase [Planctomycetota bacterium]